MYIPCIQENTCDMPLIRLLHNCYINVLPLLQVHLFGEEFCQSFCILYVQYMCVHFSLLCCRLEWTWGSSMLATSLCMMTFPVYCGISVRMQYGISMIMSLKNCWNMLKLVFIHPSVCLSVHMTIYIYYMYNIHTWCG